LASFSISAIFNPKRELGSRNHTKFAPFSISGFFWAFQNKNFSKNNECGQTY